MLYYSMFAVMINVIIYIVTYICSSSCLASWLRRPVGMGGSLFVPVVLKGRRGSRASTCRNPVPRLASQPASVHGECSCSWALTSCSGGLLVWGPFGVPAHYTGLESVPCRCPSAPFATHLRSSGRTASQGSGLPLPRSRC